MEDDVVDAEVVEFTHTEVSKMIREAFEVGKRAGQQLQRDKHMHGYDIDRLVERLTGVEG